MLLIISLGPSIVGSNSTFALLVAKATTALSTPFLLSRVLSIRRTQEEHVIPSIYRLNRKGIKIIYDYIVGVDYDGRLLH